MNCGRFAFKTCGLIEVEKSKHAKENIKGQRCEEEVTMVSTNELALPEYVSLHSRALETTCVQNRLVPFHCKPIVPAPWFQEWIDLSMKQLTENDGTRQVFHRMLG